jgi:hypothetical protein
MFRLMGRRWRRLALGGALGLLACGGERSEPPNGSPPGQQPGSGMTAPSSCFDIEQEFQRLETYRVPSWEEIDCHTKSLARSQVGIFKRLNIAYGTFGMVSNVHLRFAESAEAIAREFPVNLSSLASTSAAPPYVHRYPLTAAQLDEKLRSLAVVYLRERSKGRALYFQNYYPPTEMPDFGSAAEFTAFVDQHFVPEKLAEARFAERLKVEIYNPLPLELEKFVDISGRRFVDTIPHAERVALGQYIADQVRDAVRPLYSGRLHAHVYHLPEREAHWTAVRYTGWDQIDGSLIGECDMPTASRQIRTQIDNYAMMAARDGIAWGIAEFAESPALLAACGTQAPEVQTALFQATIDHLTARGGFRGLTIGLWGDPRQPLLPATRQVVADFYRSVP